MKTRILHTRFWKDNFVSQLSRTEKLIFVYLLTNEYINITGIYELPDKYIKNDLDVTQSELDQTKNKLQEVGKVIFLNGWVKIVNADKYNSYNGEKLQKAREKENTESPKELIDSLYPINTSIHTSIYTPNNHKSLRKEIVKGKTYTDKNLSLDEVANGVVQAFNLHCGLSLKSINGFKTNLAYWLETYSPQDIEQAIKNIKYDDFWNGKMTPTLLFRTKNPRNEPVDYIEQLLSVKKNKGNTSDQLISLINK